MNRHLTRYSLFVVGNTLVWGVIEVIALFRSRWENSHRQLQR